MDLGDDAYWDRKIQEREREEDERVARYKMERDTRAIRGCPCACNSGGFCGGCGHAGCGGRR